MFLSKKKKLRFFFAFEAIKRKNFVKILPNRYGKGIKSNNYNEMKIRAIISFASFVNDMRNVIETTLQKIFHHFVRRLQVDRNHEYDSHDAVL